MRFSRVILLACLALTACVTPIHQANWTIVKSPNFEIMSTMTNEATVELAENLGRFRALIFAVTTAPRTPAPVPTRILAFQKVSDFTPFSPLRQAAGFFSPSVRANNVALADYARGLDATTVIYHEYVHFVLQNGTSVTYPVWYDEGFAEVLSTVQTHEGKLIVGAVPPARIPSLERGQWLSMKRVLEATSYSDVPAHSLHMFYAEAWALAHYVTLDRAGEGSPDEYFALLESGVEPAEAYERVFSESIGDSGQAIRTKLKRGDWRIVGIPLENLEYDRTPPESRVPLEGEVATRLGAFHISMGKPDRAQPLFQAALEIDSGNARAHAGMGDALRYQEEFEAAEPHFRKAVELDPKDPLNQLDLAEYLSEGATRQTRGAKRDALFEEARLAFDRARELDPQAPETYVALGSTYLAAGEDAERAVPLIERGFKALPSLPYVIELLAEAYLATGREQDAHRVLLRSVAIREEGTPAENIEKILAEIRQRRALAREALEPTSES
jgi:tetratricopeptide (TPR) repeat protein